MKDMDVDDDAFKGIEAIIHSMTPEERSQPSIIRCQSKKTNWEGKWHFSSRGKSVTETIQSNE